MAFFSFKWALVAFIAVAVRHIWLASPFELQPRPCLPFSEFEGPYRVNEILLKADKIAEGKLRGPETISVQADGGMVVCLENGTLLHVTSAGDVTQWAYVGGHPLGSAFDPQTGDLYLAEPTKGLMRVSATTLEMTVLANMAGGVPIRYANDVAVGSDGTVYFTDSTDVAPPVGLNGHAAYNPRTRDVRVLSGGFYFANGVALSRDENAVLIVESLAFRVARYWLKGPRAGMVDIFADKLPGAGDGIRCDKEEGTCYVAIFTPTPPILKFTCKLPHPALVLFVQKLVSSVTPYKGRLLIGTLEGSFIGSLDMKYIQDSQSSAKLAGFLSSLGLFKFERNHRKHMSDMRLAKATARATAEIAAVAKRDAEDTLTAALKSKALAALLPSMFACRSGLSFAAATLDDVFRTKRGGQHSMEMIVDALCTPTLQIVQMDSWPGKRAHYLWAWLWAELLGLLPFRPYNRGLHTLWRENEVAEAQLQLIPSYVPVGPVDPSALQI